MLVLPKQNSYSYQNKKCGEIFCITSSVFNVTCCVCGTKTHLEQFAHHFQIQHLNFAETNIDFEVLVDKKQILASDDLKLLEPVAIKEEYSPIAEDPNKDDGLETHVKLASPEEQTEDEEDNRCLQELIIEAKARRKRLGKSKKVKDSPNKQLKSKNVSKNHDEKEELLAEEIIVDPLQPKECEEILDPCLNAEILSQEEPDHNSIDEQANSDSDSTWFAEENVLERKPDTAKKSSPELAFSCEICQRSYSTKNGLQKHNSSVHNPNKRSKGSKEKPKNQCDICNEVFRSAPILRAHMYKHTGIVCDICGMTFTQVCNLVQHKVRHTGVKKFKCKECDKQFFTSTELKAHMIYHTQAMAAVCEICGKGCRNMALFRAHMRRHTGERPAKCNVCGKGFFTGRDLNLHAVSHTSERPFKCDICGSTFQRKKALRIHKRIHSNDRRHVCKVCGKGFSQSSSLNTHIRTHDAAVEKPTSSSVTSVHLVVANGTDNATNRVIIGGYSDNNGSPFI